MSDLENIQKPFIFLANKAKGDKYIWAAIGILVVTSLLVVYSATGSLAYKMNHGNAEIYLIKQVFFAVLGLGCVYFLHKMNYAYLARLSTVLYYFSLILLLYTLFFGAEINDGSRWIKVPVINLTIQTSDIAKLALFIYLSRLLSKKQEVIKDFKKGFLPLIAPIAMTSLLILPANLSNALLTAATSLMLLFIGRVPFKYLAVPIAIGLIFIGGLVLYAKVTYNKSSDQSSISETRYEQRGLFKRFDTWVSRVQDHLFDKADKKSSYQVEQAKIAIANGSILHGLGPGNSRQRNFLPQAYNDFIYSIIIEEYGLIGGIIVLFVYLIFLHRCILIFRKCPFAFGAFLALALSFTLMIQAVANMAVNVNLMPVTGVTLPLVSMGGSSFLFTCISIGIILSVSRNVEMLEGKASDKKMKEAEAEEAELEKESIKKSALA